MANTLLHLEKIPILSQQRSHFVEPFLGIKTILFGILVSTSISIPGGAVTVSFENKAVVSEIKSTSSSCKKQSCCSFFAVPSALSSKYGSWSSSKWREHSNFDNPGVPKRRGKCQDFHSVSPRKAQCALAWDKDLPLIGSNDSHLRRHDNPFGCFHWFRSSEGFQRSCIDYVDSTLGIQDCTLNRNVFSQQSLSRSHFWIPNRTSPSAWIVIFSIILEYQDVFFDRNLTWLLISGRLF